MIAHDFVANPWPRDECDAKVSDDGRNTRQCGRPAREHAKPKTAEERIKELEANARSVAKAHADEIAGLRTELDAERQQVADAREQLYETTEAHNALVGLNTPLTRAAVAALAELSRRGVVRCVCDKRATCCGVYEDPEGPIGFGCDECCGHGNEDGWCVRLPAVTGTPSDSSAIRKLDQAGAVGCKPEGLTVHRPDPEGLPPRSTEERSGG